MNTKDVLFGDVTDLIEDSGEVEVAEEAKDTCPVCGSEIIRVSRCRTCSFCGWGTCGL